MPIRVVARIRPVLPWDHESDVVIRPAAVDGDSTAKTVLVAPLQEDDEEQTFDLDGVYGSEVSQEAFFNAEAQNVAKYLFQGKDVTYIAYGTSGTGKTHTMRGGLKLDERGLVPRLISSIFRRSKKAAIDASEDASVRIMLSYLEIYRDQVYDLFNPPMDRSSGNSLKLQEVNGQTQVLGLTEIECLTLKDFSKFYIEANKHRVSAGTKLNFHSSRSHAVFRVRVVQSLGGVERSSTASAVDLAGSEDSRKADTSIEGLAEAAAINKSLFAMTKCIDAMYRGDRRVPYRDSKLTRILALGQKPKTQTTMILNLAPVRNCITSTMNCLNVCSRTRRIEAREIENELVFKQAPRQKQGLGSGTENGRRALGILFEPIPETSPSISPTETTEIEFPIVPPPASSAPVKMFTVFKDDGTPVQRRRRSTRASLSNIAKNIFAVRSDVCTPSKVTRFRKSPLKRRQPLRTRAVATLRRDENQDAPYKDELVEGMRYLEQSKQYREARGSVSAATESATDALYTGKATFQNCAEKLRIWSETEVNVTEATAVSSSSSINTPDSVKQRRLADCGVSALPSRIPVARSGSTVSSRAKRMVTMVQSSRDHKLSPAKRRAEASAKVRSLGALGPIRVHKTRAQPNVRAL
ncbi:hypothetical protein TD95_000258 [Thielaviopsis punctulata]|uniref:Kinesin motor domain-containing protein n=1 Tax=Thielaviopsis punctulata TaxID=72032 RepID=A0A0F4ZFH1_9PEZI|nr:hypothetical protein TD95_000258 [Thielaviopsis punctulata]